MGILHLVLLVVGIVLIVAGARALYLRAWVAGVIEIVIGLVLLGYGGFIAA